MLEENAHWNTALVEVNLHAISTDASSGHPACIYAQIGNEYDEIRLIPSGDDAVSLNTLYEALCVAVEQNTTDENLDDSIAPFLRAGDEAYAEAGDSDGQARALPGAEAMLARLDALVGESTAANGVDDKEEDTES